MNLFTELLRLNPGDICVQYYLLWPPLSPAGLSSSIYECRWCRSGPSCHLLGWTGAHHLLMNVTRRYANISFEHKLRPMNTVRMMMMMRMVRMRMLTMMMMEMTS